MLIQKTFIKYFLTDIVFSIDDTAENEMNKLLVLMELMFWWEGQIKTKRNLFQVVMGAMTKIETGKGIENYVCVVEGLF